MWLNAADSHFLSIRQTMLRHTFSSIFLFPVVLRAVFVVCSMGCGAADVTVPFSSPHSYAAEYVIHISVDGLNAEMMQQVIDAGNAPNFKRLQDEGAWTTNARTDYTHTNTLPNHTCMFTGRPVLQPDGMPDTRLSRLDDQRRAASAAPRCTTRESRRSTTSPACSTSCTTPACPRRLYASKRQVRSSTTRATTKTTAREHQHGRDKIDVYFFTRTTGRRDFATR